MAQKKKIDPMRGIRLHGSTYQLRITVRGARHTFDLNTADAAEAIRNADRIRCNPERCLNPAGAWEQEARAYTQLRMRQGKFTETTAKCTTEAIMLFMDATSIETPSAVRFQDLQDWYELLSENLSESTAHTYVARVAGFLKNLSETKRTRFDPHRKLQMKAIDAAELARSQSATRDEVRTLIHSCDRLDLKFVLFAGFQAGMRRGEIVNARTSWFDFKARIITIPSKQIVNGKVWRPKTKRKREIPLMPEFEQFLRNEFPLNGKDEYILHPDADGKLYRWDFRRPFEEYVEEHGLEWLIPHLMRHTFTSLCLEANYNLEKVASWIGDRKETVERHYSHIRPRVAEIHVDPFQLDEPNGRAAGRKPLDATQHKIDGVPHELANNSTSAHPSLRAA